MCFRYSEERDSDEAALYRRPPKPPPEPAAQFFEPSVHDDSVKTYYTEGTPYETPYNFSTANSMTDLREPAIKEIEREEAAGTTSSEVGLFSSCINLAYLFLYERGTFLSKSPVN